MLKTNPQKVDDFFMERVWDFPVREQVHDFSMSLLDIYTQTLSKHLDLPIRDTQHLSREMGYHAISVYLDTVFRLKHKGVIPAVSSDFNVDYENILTQFFSNEIVGTSLGASRVFRCRLSNVILHTFGALSLFQDEQIEPEQIKLEDLDLPLASEEKYWRLHNNLTYRIPNYVIQHSKAYWSRLCKKFRKDLIHIGYINLDYKNMEQLPDIRWIALDIKLDNYTKAVPIEVRLSLYKVLREGFMKKAKELAGWELIVGHSNIPAAFFEMMLAFIVLKSESLLCQKEHLHQAIECCKISLQESKLQALFSIGNWFRFENAIIATAGRDLKLPVLEFQSGGRVLDKDGKGFDSDVVSGGKYYLDHMFYWGGMDCNNDFQHHPKFHRVPYPFLLAKFNYFSKKRHNRNCINIIYTPIALSHLYSVENWLSASTYDIKEIRDYENTAFSYLDQISFKRDIKIFIKIKGFSYSIYRNRTFMLFPTADVNNISVKYLINGDVEHYFRYMDVHISCSNSTTFVYSMNYNIPTIILWQDVFKVKKEYSSLFDDLVEVGIICTDINLLPKIYDKISDSKYWLSKKVQNTRNIFCATFGYTSADWKKEINTQISNVINK
jgi:hypothetical protein